MNRRASTYVPDANERGADEVHRAEEDREEREIAWQRRSGGIREGPQAYGHKKYDTPATFCVSASTARHRVMGVKARWKRVQR